MKTDSPFEFYEKAVLWASDVSNLVCNFKLKFPRLETRLFFRYVHISQDPQYFLLTLSTSTNDMLTKSDRIDAYYGDWSQPESRKNGERWRSVRRVVFLLESPRNVNV